jgi:uncharacterized protein YjiS (DUF1127 family)
MSTVLSTPAPQRKSGPLLLRGLVVTLKRWWVAYITWHVEQAAIAHLWSKSDHTLKDSGLALSEIPHAVRPRWRLAARSVVRSIGRSEHFGGESSGMWRGERLFTLGDKAAREIG